MAEFKRLTVSRAVQTDAAATTTTAIAPLDGEYLRIRTVSRVGEPVLTLNLTANGVETVIVVDNLDMLALGSVSASDSITLTATLNVGEEVDVVMETIA